MRIFGGEKPPAPTPTLAVRGGGCWRGRFVQRHHARRVPLAADVDLAAVAAATVAYVGADLAALVRAAAMAAVLAAAAAAGAPTAAGYLNGDGDEGRAGKGTILSDRR